MQILDTQTRAIAGRQALLRVFATADERYTIGHQRSVAWAWLQDAG